MCTARNNHHLLRAIHFFTEVNDTFVAVKSHFLFIGPLPAMNNFFEV